jgi:GNAT superfamily N-acetyltransferase
MTDLEYSLHPATSDDAEKVTALVNAAYGHYVERIGMTPRPMTYDYTEVIRNSRVTVAESNQTMVGVIVLNMTDEEFLIDNVAVDPSYHGKGVGKALLTFGKLRPGGVRFHLSLHTREDDGKSCTVCKDWIRGVRSPLPGEFFSRVYEETTHRDKLAIEAFELLMKIVLKQI